MELSLENLIKERIHREQEKKGRYNFTISPSVKTALAAWCKENTTKESHVIETLLLEMIPKKFFKSYKKEQ